MTPTGYACYRNVIANTTESKEKILLMLYERALFSVKIARRGIEEKNPRLKGENISRALAILSELDCALDREKGGELAENLAALYRYSMNRLTFANIQCDLDAIQEVERILTDLFEGFKGATRQVCRPVSAGTAEPATVGRLAIAI